MSGPVATIRAPSRAATLPIGRSNGWPVRDVVVDSSVVVAWALPDEALHPSALRLVDQLIDGELEPVVATPFAFEVRHALIRAARAGRLDWSTIPSWLGAIEALEPTRVEPEPDETGILHLAERLGLTWGDAHWVDVAKRLDLPLLTADRRLARAVPDEIAVVVYLGDDAAV